MSSSTSHRRPPHARSRQFKCHPQSRRRHALAPSPWLRRSPPPTLNLAYPDACGVDIGSTSHFVAVPADRDDAPVREFRAFTADLHSLIDWLRQVPHELPKDGLGTPKRGTPARISVNFDACAALFEASGVDLTRIPGIDTSKALKVISEVGVDLQRVPTVKHFTSWMG